MKRWMMAILLFVSLATATRRARGQPPWTEHKFDLPPRRYIPFLSTWSYPDAAVGQLPSADHPRGTVIVLGAPSASSGPTVSEWDVASGRTMLAVDLPLPASFVELKIVHAGDRIHTVLGEVGGGRMVYVRLTRGLVVEARQELGTGYGPRIATDGSLVAVMWSGFRGALPGVRGWHLLTFDSTGKELGASWLSDSTTTTEQWVEPLAVLDHEVYVLSPGTNTRDPAVLKLRADGFLEQQQRLTPQPDDGYLFAWAGRLLYRDGCAFEVVAKDSLRPGGEGHRVPYPPKRPYPWCPYFWVISNDSGWLVTSNGDILSPDLRVDSHFADPGGGCSRPLWIGGIPAMLVTGPNGRAWMTWSDPATTSPPRGDP